jgi:manganese transport protein
MYYMASATRTGHRRTRVGRRSRLPLLGPAFVAAIAYIDPGNFATNITAGADYGYLLVWVIVASNLMAMLIQYLSAKSGIATGRSLPELCRDHFPRSVVLGLWVQAELVAIATDLAEIVGGALALKLLFGLPMLTGGTITAVVSLALLTLRGHGHRPFETAVTGLLGVIMLGFLYDLAKAGVHPLPILSGTVPQFDGADSVVLAAGMLGATVMPHAIYLHSGLTSSRHPATTEAQRHTLLAAQRVDVVTAMTIAGLMNLALLVIAAAALSGTSTPLTSLEQAHSQLGRVLGAGAALAFACALLASGFAASSVGTLSGQFVMEGFLRLKVPLLVRRLVSLAPALLLLAGGVDATQALLTSQVVLSFGIPFALVPLVLFTRRADVMGSLVNRQITTVAASAAAVVIIALNMFLISRVA